jgi:hypothetical protein
MVEANKLDESADSDDNVMVLSNNTNVLAISNMSNDFAMSNNAHELGRDQTQVTELTTEGNDNELD